MDSTDRKVRASVYAQFLDGDPPPTVWSTAGATGIDDAAVAESFARLEDDHSLVLDSQRTSVLMAHPFSGRETGYRTQIEDRTWDANCGWDAFAILAMLGDGTVESPSPLDGTRNRWTVEGGRVEQPGIVHFVVRASQFWDNIEFT